jgi:hypothetical protein
MSATQATSRAFLTWGGVFKFNPCIKGEFIEAPEVKNDFRKDGAHMCIVRAPAFVKSHFALPFDGWGSHSVSARKAALPTDHAKGA